MKIILLITLSFSIIAILISFVFTKNDGMQQTRGASVFYKTYNKHEGWTKWSKNGNASGTINSRFSIENIDIKLKTKLDGTVKIKYYTSKNKWSKNNSTKLKNKNSIYAIRLAISGDVRKKYDICYRTYNKKNYWLEWACNGEISGNINEKISQLEIKVIPKNIIVNEYLKDYGMVNNPINIGF